ncbi:MAG: gliding motility-associated C-terminal domain-containing protein [Bacteroidota bacterium]
MSHRLFCRVCLLALFLGSSLRVSGQSYSGINWFFGSNDNSFRFVRPNLDAEQITLPNNLGFAGAAVATDPVSGELLFYTDGIRVYDRSNFELVNNLQGSTTRNQGTVICENPGNADEIYIFVINNTGVISQSIFDKTLARPGVIFPDLPEGNISTLNSPITGIPGPLSEGMIIVPNDQNNAFWLINHLSGTNDYVVTEIDNGGLLTTTTFTLPGTPTNVSNFSYNLQTNRIAVSPTNGVDNIAILDINPATGELVNSAIDLSTITTNGIYDIEWNNNGELIYVSGNFGAAEDSLVQISINEAPLVVRPVLTTNMARSFGLQIAPDSAIYHLYEADNGQFRVGRINEPDSIDTSQPLFAGLVEYDPRAFVDIDPVNQQVNDFDFEAFQFPAFLPFLEPTFTVDFSWFGECQNEEVLFFPEISAISDSVFWDFGDGNSSTVLSPVHTFEDAQSFPVTLTAFVNGVGRQAVNNVTINAFDITIDVETDTTFCQVFFPPPYGSDGTASVVATAQNASSVSWFNGFTTQPGNTLLPDSSGIYWVVATDGSGCSTSETVTVNTYGENRQLGFVWYFGNRAGIDFNPLTFNDPVVNIPINDPTIYNGGNQMITPEGCAIYCDPNGQPLFYSDGVDVYDRQGTLLTPIDKLEGSNDATQSTLIVPFEGDETLYYIFTTREVYNTSNTYDLYYAVFDLKLNNGFGELVRNQDNEISTLLCTGITERITGSENWIIVHEFGNNNFKAFPIQGDGIGNAVVSNVGSIHSTDREAQGYMILNDQNQIAVAYSVGTNENFVELFDFDETNGAVTEFLTLDFNDPDRLGGPPAVNGQVYGVEFSGDGSNLFATINGTSGSQVYLWHLDSANGGAADPTYIRDSVELVDISALPNVPLGAIELGPDGQLYIAMQGEQQVATINAPNTVFGQPVPVANTFGLAPGTNSNLGLPNFIQNPFGSEQNARIDVEDGCSRDEFTFTVEDALDETLERYQINIFDGNDILVQSETLTQDDPSVTYNFSEPGNYRLEFTILIQCPDYEGVPFSDVTTNQSFNVNPLPEVTLVSTSSPSSCIGNDGSAEVRFETVGELSYSVSGRVSYPATTIFSDGVSNITIPGLTDGEYIINVVVAETGCEVNFDFPVAPPIPYSITAAQTQEADCDGMNGEIRYTLSGAGVPTNFTWELRILGSSNVVANGNQNDLSTTISPVDLGEYIFDFEDENGCNSAINVVITQPPGIALNLDPGPYSVCDDEILTFNFTTNSVPTVLITNLDGSVASNVRVPDANETIEVQNPGVLGESITYAVTAFGDGSITCDTTAFFTVSYGESSENPFDSRFALCPFEQDPYRRFVMLENPPEGFSSIRWLDRDGVEITSSTPGYRFSTNNDSLIVEDIGPITAEITNVFGCTTEADIVIVQDCQGRINAPTAFYPNSAVQANQQFVVFPFLVESQDFQIFIFNRWGEMVFQSSDLEEMRVTGWNGGYDNDLGRPLPGGAYAYKVEFRSQFEPEKGLIERRGGVNLIR